MLQPATPPCQRAATVSHCQPVSSGLSHAARQAGCKSLLPLPSNRRPTPNSHPSARPAAVHTPDASDRHPTAQLTPRRTPITWPHPAAVHTPDASDRHPSAQLTPRRAPITWPHPATARTPDASDRHPTAQLAPRRAPITWPHLAAARTPDASDRHPSAQLAPRRAPITWPRLAAARTPDAGSGGGLDSVGASSRAPHRRRARRERCDRAPAGSGTRSAVRCTDRRNCSSRRRGATPRAARRPECTAIGAPGGAAARCLRGVGLRRLPPRVAIELRRPFWLRRRRSVATAIRRCQRGRPALVRRRRRPWRRYGAAGPTICHRTSAPK